MIVRPPLIMPALPIPAMTLPTINIKDEGAAPHTRDPISNKTRKTKKDHCINQFGFGDVFAKSRESRTFELK